MTFISLLAVALITGLIYLVYLLLKIDNACDNQFKIIDAIDAYTRATGDCDTALKMVASMEDLEKTIFRLWDWGCKNILPYKYYKLIEPYIQ